MSRRLASLSSLEVVKILSRNGFKEARKDKGSHRQMSKTLPNGKMIRLTVPMGKKDVSLNTLYSIIEKSELPREAFLKKRKGSKGGGHSVKKRG